MNSLHHHLFLESVIIFGGFVQFSDDWTDRRSQEEAALGAPLDSLEGRGLAGELDDAFTLAAAAIVNEDHGALEVSKNGEGFVEKFVGNPRTEVLHLDSSLVRREPNFDDLTISWFTVKLTLGLLGLVARSHSKESELLLAVHEDLSHFAKGSHHLLQGGLSHVIGQVSKIEP